MDTVEKFQRSGFAEDQKVEKMVVAVVNQKILFIQVLLKNMSLSVNTTSVKFE